MVVTCGCVSVCTKSVFGAAVAVVAVVVVMVGTCGTLAVVSIAGTVCGFFLVRQAGASTAATIARLTANDFTALVIVPPSYQVGCWPLAVGRDFINCQLPTANHHGCFFDQSGSLFSPSNVNCIRSVPSTLIL